MKNVFTILVVCFVALFAMNVYAGNDVVVSSDNVNFLDNSHGVSVQDALSVNDANANVISLNVLSLGYVEGDQLLAQVIEDARNVQASQAGSKAIPLSTSCDCYGDVADSLNAPNPDGEVSSGDVNYIINQLSPTFLPITPVPANLACADVADETGAVGSDGKVSFGDVLYINGLLAPSFDPIDCIDLD